MLPVRLPQRFQFVRELGRGGMGAVYEAIDHEGGGRVAIKTLPSNDPLAIARFKREFRSLQDIHHPHLVSLGALFCEDGQWAFSMDLIDGTDFIDHVRDHTVEQRPDVPESLLEGDTTSIGLAGIKVNVEIQSGVRVSIRPSLAQTSLPAFNEERLRDAFVQLTMGLDALHGAGKIHRDIKPSNIRVRTDGHVFLLDFGLVAELTVEDDLSGHQHILGTPSYMAPEQASGGAVSAAADWYSVGVVLFEALTGTLPFEGPQAAILLAKQKFAAPRVRSLVPAAPADLDELCARLLEFDPKGRPDASEILRAFRPPSAEESGGARGQVRGASSSIVPTFIGRRDQLDVLDHALEATRKGFGAAVLLEGESGAGKTYLAKRFLERVQLEKSGAIVVQGRCYENEAVPYNAWDSAIEALASYFMRLEGEAAAALLPVHISALVQTFPALRRVPAITRATIEVSTKIDPREVRARAFTALRELFQKLAESAPFILFLDDIQWADHDSVSLLGEILRPPSPPSLLFLATTRPLSDYPDTARGLAEALPRSATRCAVTELSIEDAVELANQLLRRADPEHLDDAASIAREARGHPFFIAELARHILSTGRVDHGPLSLKDALQSRIAGLPQEAQMLVTVLSLAARPLPETVAARAAGLDPTAAPRVLSALRVGHLARWTRIEGIDWLETYHDRIRSAVVDGIEEGDRRRVFERLALAFEGNIHGDPNLLTDFWSGAGDAERAGRYALEAGHSACRALAFDRAVRFYGIALLRPSCTDDERHHLEVLLGDTLAKAGRGTEAAEVYKRALSSARNDVELLDLEQKAGEQLLRAGDHDAGIAITKKVIERVGIAWPRSPLVALATIVFCRLALAVRGQQFVNRHANELAPEELTRIDICFNVCTWLQMSDSVRSLVFHVHNLRLALRAGEARRVSMAISEDLLIAGIVGGGHPLSRFRKLEKQIMRARALAEGVDKPYETALCDGAEGIALVAACRPRRGVGSLERAEARFRSGCSGKFSEVVVAQMWAFRGYFHLGEFAKLRERQPAALQEASDRRDLFGTRNLRIGFPNFAWLVRGEVENANIALVEGLRDSMTRAFSSEHHYGLISQTNNALYEWNPARAAALVAAAWPAMKRSHVRNIFVSVRFQSSDYQARIHLAHVAAKLGDPRDHLARAKSFTRDLSRTTIAYAAPMSELLRAQLAAVEGDEGRTVVLLRQAIPKLAEFDLCAYVAVAKRALGRRLGGDEGAALVHAGESFLREQRVADLAAISRCLAPGFGENG